MGKNYTRTKFLCFPNYFPKHSEHKIIVSSVCGIIGTSEGTGDICSIAVAGQQRPEVSPVELETNLCKV